MIESAKQFRNGMFPEVDFDSAEGIRYVNDIRATNNVKKLSMKEWFYFHPTAYVLLSFGTPIMMMILFGIIGTYGFFTHNNYFFGLGIVIVLVFVRDLYKKNKMKGMMKEKTFNDIWFGG